MRAGAYEVVAASLQKVELACEASPAATPTTAGKASASTLLRAVKTFSFSTSADGFAVTCELSLSHGGPAPLKLNVGLHGVRVGPAKAMALLWEASWETSDAQTAWVSAGTPSRWS